MLLYMVIEDELFFCMLECTGFIHRCTELPFEVNFWWVILEMCHKKGQSQRGQWGFSKLHFPFLNFISRTVYQGNNCSLSGLMMSYEQPTMKDNLRFLHDLLHLLKKRLKCWVTISQVSIRLYINIKGTVRFQSSLSLNICLLFYTLRVLERKKTLRNRLILLSWVMDSRTLLR